MKKGISIFLAVLLSAFITLMFKGAAFVLIIAGFVVCLRIYLRSRSLPEQEAFTLKSSTANRVGQVLIVVPIIKVVLVVAAMSGVFAK